MVDELPLNPAEKTDPANSLSPKSISDTEGTGNYYKGFEPFFSFFTQAQIILNTLRLTLEYRVVVPTAELGAQLESARRNFQHSGNLIVVMQDVARITAQFHQRVQLWQREVQNRERDKHGMNGALIQRLKAEAAQIRGRIHAIDRALIKLEVKLHQMAGEAQGER